MSFSTLAEDKYNALTFGLDHHIPAKTIKNTENEFEVYPPSINCYVNEIPDNVISHLKTKLRNHVIDITTSVYHINFEK